MVETARTAVNKHSTNVKKATASCVVFSHNDKMLNMFYRGWSWYKARRLHPPVFVASWTAERLFQGHSVIAMRCLPLKPTTWIAKAYRKPIAIRATLDPVGKVNCLAAHLGLVGILTHSTLVSVEKQ
jgi:hypothetical protein